MGSNSVSLARKATELVNACGFFLKLEASRPEARLKEQCKRLRDMAFPTPLSFDKGVRSLVTLCDVRQDRLELGIRRLLKLALESVTIFPHQQAEDLKAG